MLAYSHSNTPPEKRDKRATPQYVFNRIQEVTGLMCCHDVCAEAETAKVPGSYWSEKDDALSIDWYQHAASRIPGYTFHTVFWMNPPYSKPADWVEKAKIEARKGLIVIGLVPDDRSVGWYQDHVEDEATLIYVPDKRISFELDGVPQKGNAKGSVFPIWTPMPVKKSNYERFELGDPNG